MAKKNILIIAFIISLTLITIIIAYNLIPNPGHGGDKIYIYINGDDKTLQQAINDGDFSVDFTGTDAGFKITSFINGHNSSDIFVNASGTIKTLQQTIDDKSICNVVAENTLTYIKTGHPAEKIVVTINSQEKTLQQLIVQDINCCNDADKDNYDNCDIGDPRGDGNEIDCDDTNPATYPGATEVCDSADNNCDGQTDEGGVCVTWISAYEENCDVACIPHGMTNVGPHKCTSGEVISAEAINQLGSGIYIHGCWDGGVVPCTVENAKPTTLLLEPVGTYCYSPEQVRDYDLTDITVACACI